MSKRQQCDRKAGKKGRVGERKDIRRNKKKEKWAKFKRKSERQKLELNARYDTV